MAKFLTYHSSLNFSTFLKFTGFIKKNLNLKNMFESVNGLAFLFLPEFHNKTFLYSINRLSFLNFITDRKY